MAIISDADVTSFVRSLLGEGTAKHWTDDEITLYIKFGMMAVESKYWYLLAPLDKKVVKRSLAENTQYVTIPGNEDSEDFSCAKIIKVEVASTGDMVRYIEPDDLSRFEEYDDGAAATDYLNIFYLQHKSATTDFPESLRPLIAIEAVMFGNTKDGTVDGALLVLHREFEGIALNFLGVSQIQEPAIISDYEVEDGYTFSNPVAWSFREGKIYLYKVRVGE